MSGRHALAYDHEIAVSLHDEMVGWAKRSPRHPKFWLAADCDGKSLVGKNFPSPEAVREWFDARLEAKS